jgi:zinc protease
MPDPLKNAAGLPVAIPGARAARGAERGGGSRVFPFPVEETLLLNGLKVVAVPFDSPGVITYWTVVRAGSRNEVEPGKSGFAHFFEHMMFRGTECYPTERYNAILKELGADHNAFTSDDLTAYHILAPSTALETLMTLESDRFMNLKYSEEAFKKEAGAILGEYNKSASSPFQTLHEKLRDAAFTTHTYKHTTIGFLKDIEDMPNQYDYSRVFFDRFYRPENCILMVVGDVDPRKLFALAARYYGSWKKGDHRLEVPAEPLQEKPRRVEVSWPNPTEPYLFLGFHVPAFSTKDPDMPALDLVSQLLFAEAAPLYQRLVVEEQEVDILSGGAPDHRDPYLFTVVARVKKADRVKYVLDTIASAFKDLQEKPVEAARLERVKSHVKYAYAMSLDTADGVAQSLAHYLALTADADTVNQIYALYDRVTPAEIQTAARKHFVPSGMTVVFLRHPDESTGTPAGATGGGG